MAGWLVITAIFSFFAFAAYAKDHGQNTDPLIKEWFRSLMQPDTIKTLSPVSCCGEGDAYYADEVKVVDGKMFAVITDTRPDGDCGAVMGGPEVPCRIHEDVGAMYEVPPQKVVGMEQKLSGNPTGHVVVFLGGIIWAAGSKTRQVLCYVPNTGV